MFAWDRLPIADQVFSSLALTLGFGMLWLVRRFQANRGLKFCPKDCNFAHGVFQVLNSIHIWLTAGVYRVVAYRRFPNSVFLNEIGRIGKATKLLLVSG